MPQPQPAPPKSKAPQAKPKVQAQPFVFADTPKSADGSSYGTDHALADEPPPQPFIPQSAGELHAMTAQAAADYEKYLKKIFDRNGNAGPTVWVDGRVVGAWRQDDTGRVELVLLEDVGRRAHRELTARAEGLTAWLDGVRVSPRFPSPACRPDARR